MTGYYITYKLVMGFQKNIIGLLVFPLSPKLTEQEIISTLVGKEPRLRQATNLSIGGRKVSINSSEDYLVKTYTQAQISEFVA